MVAGEAGAPMSAVCLKVAPERVSEGWKCLAGIAPSMEKSPHRTLHSPSMVASTAPPGQNSITIWETKREELKSGWHLTEQSPPCREETKALGFASLHGKAAPLPHPGMQRLWCSPGHIPQAPPAQTITQASETDPAHRLQQPSRRDRPHRRAHGHPQQPCLAPYLDAHPEQPASAPASSLFTSFPVAFWSEGCSRERPCQQEEIAVIAGS